jgi:hypothetical protein
MSFAKLPAVARVLRAASVAVAALLQSVSVVRAEADDLPQYTVLQCKDACGTFVNAKRISTITPIFPSQYKSNMESGEIFDSEAVVMLHYTVAKDGGVKDVVLDRVFGPPGFGEISAKNVSNWRYEPATLNGEAVDQPNMEIGITFRCDSCKQGARESVVSAYTAAKRLAAKDKSGEAIEVLKKVLAGGHLMLYERTMISNSLALLFINIHDFENALYAERDATLCDGMFLDPRTIASAFERLVLLEANAGNYAAAEYAYDVLKKKNLAKADSPVARTIAGINKTKAISGPLGMPGKIPPDDVAHSWKHYLMCRSFGFSEVKGSLERFQLRCDRESIESPINTTAQWTISEKMSRCTLYVYGAPGTTFTVIEK